MKGAYLQESQLAGPPFCGIQYPLAVVVEWIISRIIEWATHYFAVCKHELIL